MRIPPVPVGESLVPREALWRAALLCAAIVVSVLGVFGWMHASGEDPVLVQTATFTLLSVCEWFNVMNVRSARRTAFDRGLFRNAWLVGGLAVAVLLQAAVVYLPFLTGPFRTTPLPLGTVALLLLAGSLVLWVEEARKAVVRARARRAGAPA
jgi:magnesium-transporting ATPase (P-type)